MKAKLMPLRDEPAHRSAVPAAHGVSEGEKRRRVTNKAYSHSGAEAPPAREGLPAKQNDHRARTSGESKNLDEHAATRKRRRRPRRSKGGVRLVEPEVLGQAQANIHTDNTPSESDKTQRRKRRGGRGRKRGHPQRSHIMAVSELGGAEQANEGTTGTEKSPVHNAQAGKTGGLPHLKRAKETVHALGDKAVPTKPAPKKTAPQKLGRAKSERTKAGQGHGAARKAKVQQGAPAYLQRRSNERTVFSAIDLGTNNCRLLIARPTQYGFRVVDAFSRIVRLGEGLGRDGSLCDAAIERAVEALKICADKIDRRSVTSMRHVATQACRIAANTSQFISTIKAETGLDIEVISPAEEARLAVMGCQSLISRSNKYALVFDIGGGSTELIWVKMRQNRQAEIHSWMSIPWGVVNLSEHYGAGTDTDPAIYAKMVDEVIGHLAAFEEMEGINRLASRHSVQFLGTSGTVTTLASLHLKLPRYMRDKVDGAWMKSHDIRSLSRSVAAMSIEERASQPCIGAERADLVVAGCAILDAILSTWSVPGLRVADRGIREGILRGLMAVDPEPLLVGSAASGLSSILPLHDKSAIAPSAQTASQVTCSCPATHDNC